MKSLVFGTPSATLSVTSFGEMFVLLDENRNVLCNSISYNDHRGKDEAEELLEKYGIKLEYNELYDHVYVINMGNNDFFGSSIPDEKHLAIYVKDVIDDEDGYDGIVFNRWYADMSRLGIPIEWEDML